MERFENSLEASLEPLNRVTPHTLNIWERIRNSVLGNPDHKPRTRPSYYASLGGGERLENRYLMSGAPIAAEVRMLDPVVTHALEAAQLSSDQESSSAGIAALEHGVNLLPTASDLQQQITASQLTIANLQKELTDAANRPTPSPIDSVNWGTVGAPSGSMGALTFPGGGNRYAVQANATGDKLITTSQSAQPIVVDVKTGQNILSLNGHGSIVIQAAFSPDGSVIATISYDRKGRIFDANTGALLEIVDLVSYGTGLKFVDNQSVAFVQGAKSTKIYDFKNHSVTSELPANYPGTPQFTADGKTAVYTDDRQIVTMDRITGALTKIDPGIGGLYALDINGSGVIVAGSSNGTVVFVDQSTLKILATIQPPAIGIVSSVLCIDQKHVLVGYQNGDIVTYDISAAASGKVIVAHTEHVNGLPSSISLTASGQTILLDVYKDSPQTCFIAAFHNPFATPIASARPTTVIAADLAVTQNQLTFERQELHDRQALEAEIQTVTTILSQQQAVQTAIQTPSLAPEAAPAPIDSVNWTRSGAPRGSAGAIVFPGAGNKYSVQVNAAGTMLVTSSQSAEPQVLDVGTGETLFSLAGHGGLVPDTAFSPDSTVIATTSYDGKGRIFDANTGALLFTANLGGIGTRVTFGPNGRVVFDRHEKTALVYDYVHQQLITELPSKYPADARFTPDGNTVCYTDDHEMVRMDLETNVVKRFDPGLGSLFSMDMQNDLMVAGSYNGTTVFVDAVMLRTLKSVPPLGSGIVTSVRFVQDGIVAIAYQSGDILLYDVSSIRSGGSPALVQTEHVDGTPGSLSASHGSFVISVASTATPAVQIAAYHLNSLTPLSEPLLKPVSLQGSNIVLAASSSRTGLNTVHFEGLHDNGIFTESTLAGNADGSITPICLGMNGSNATGEYRVVLSDPFGRTLSSFGVHWDHETKQLSLPSSQALWTPSAVQGVALDAATQEMVTLAQNPTSNNTLLGAMQQESLIDGMRSLPEPYASMSPQCEEAFWKTHPEWKDDQIHATAQRNFEKQTGHFTITQIFEGLVRQRNEELSAVRTAYGKYYGMLGDLLQQALTVLSGIRSGGNEPALRHAFAITTDQYATSLPMYQLSGVGIRIPTADQLLDCVKDIWTEKWKVIVASKTAESQLAAQQAYAAQLASAGNFVQAANGEWVAKSDPRATSGLVFYVDAQGRQTLLPPAQTVAGTSGMHVEANKNSFLVANQSGNLISDVQNKNMYALIDAGKSIVGTANLMMASGSVSTLRFDITEDKMVNFGVPGVVGNRLIVLEISGSGLGTQKYATHHAQGSGETVSLHLPKGTYTLTISDNTDYRDMVHAPFAHSRFSVPLETNIKPYTSANIEGKISIEGNEKIMPVSMRVAEFDQDTGERKKNYEATSGREAISKLDPTKPVWVVVHGRVNSEDSSQIVDLTRNLKNLGVQVVTLDWAGGAKDNLSPIGLEGQKWIEQVGTWAADQLKAAGFGGQNINVIGHSWGAYVSYEIGRHTSGGVKALVALDPAADTVILGGGAYHGFNDPNFKFSDVAANSYAFHSSDFGNAFLAKTAEYSFDIRAPKGYEQNGQYTTGITQMAHDYWDGGLIDNSQDASREHGFAVSLFSELLHRNKVSPSDPTAQIFSIAHLQSAEDEILSDNGFDGVFFASPAQTINSDGTEAGKAVWIANSFGFSAKDQFGNDIINPRTL